MKLVIDTSAYSAFNRGDSRLRRWFSVEHQLLVPLIVLGELRAGFACGSQATANNQLLNKFLDAPNVEILKLSNSTTKLYAAIFSQLRAEGKPIGSNDMWIAALTQEHDGQLITLDADFGAIKNLNLVDL